MAKINNNGRTSLIGTNGKLSDIKFSDKELPFIFGKPAINEFIKFANVIEKSKFSLNQVKNLYFFPSKRWDLELKNNVILKLSKDQTKISLDQVCQLTGLSLCCLKYGLKSPDKTFSLILIIKKFFFYYKRDNHKTNKH